jgi:ATP-dependent exoDNAse (exonuclease V) beta subunit
MGAGTLTIYSASAGSGKTFRLAGNYLSLLFRSGYHYRKILAVTFTNKATAEMKGRILDQLHRLAAGEKSEYLPDLMAATGRTEESLREGAKEILFSILHDFSRFSVSTIDAFFQKIIRAFARESGLNSGFNMELDHSLVLSSAVDEMIISSASDQQLNSWLASYIMSNLGEEKTWNIRDGILNLSQELFREKFKILSAEEISKLENKELLIGYINKLKSTKSAFEKKMADLGRKGCDIISEYGLTDDMFYNKSRGVPGFIKSLAQGKLSNPNDKVRAAIADQPRWSTGEPPRELLNAVTEGLDSIIRDAIDNYDRNIIHYNSVIAMLSNIYALGILSDVLKKVHEVAFDNNTFLISDSAELLSLITKGDQTPFIYEKIGNRFENFMIDEFQDTSVLQWNNFNPLIKNSMAEGFDNLVVGDIKQSIYRFRNSDWKILGNMLESEVNGERILSIPLQTNYRSSSNIIRFNNSLFSIIPEIADKIFSDKPDFIKFKKLYSEAVQKDSGKAGGGYVRIEFIQDGNESDASEHVSAHSIPPGITGTEKWNDLVLDRLPSIIEAFEDKGFKASDIGILVRDGREGAEVLRSIIEYSNTCSPEKRNFYDYNIVSNDSLALTNSNAVIFIISVLKVIDDPDDSVSRAMMIRYFLLATDDKQPADIPLYRETLFSGTINCFPDGYDKLLTGCGNLTLFEITEKIIGFFRLGRNPSNVPYLTTFQDLILEYSLNKNTDIHSFIEWWEISGGSKSLILPAGQNAIRIFTIHKSKGLEFPVVILPFLSWNLDHKPSRQPIIWVKPPQPFNDLGIVPVRYGSGLTDTVFAGSYYEEQYSSYLDNINLLYVGMTRAIDAIYGFAPENPGPYNAIARLIRDALLSDINPAGESGILMSRYYNREEKIFEFGEIPVHSGSHDIMKKLKLDCYEVNDRPRSLKLKLHSENFFSAGTDTVRQRINYGQIMHEVFEGIDSSENIADAVRRIVLEGKIEESESEKLILKLKTLVSEPPVHEWFMPGNELIKENGILLPSGTVKRPDRVVLRDGKTIVIDFKFGEEKSHYITQIRQYQTILNSMGYNDTQAFLWYVDKNKIINI